MNTILIVYSAQIESYKKHFLDKMAESLNSKHYELVVVNSLKEAAEICRINARITAILYDWDDFGFNELHAFVDCNTLLPIFALTNQRVDLDLNLPDFDLTLDFLQYDVNLIEDDVNRILLAINHYQTNIVPPFTRALMHYVKELNYAFCTPGHLGGTAFQKTPSGVMFYDFLGGNIFKSDLSISIDEMGSLLDHSGPHREAEDFIATTFGSDRSFIVTNGTSTANKIVGMYSASSKDTVLVDRNCHKSIAHFLMMVDVIPIYLKPTRNAYGILGGIPQSEYTKEAIQKKLDSHPEASRWPTYAVITNSTYDGILYQVEKIQKKLNVAHLHFDGAWVPYTKFHPIYAHQYGMSLTPNDGQVIFETQSTHKLLAAFSQSSMIHIKGNYDEHIFNENYMMHTSTSPFYPMVASCEISAAMMCHGQGYRLLNECIRLSLDFRNEVRRLKKQANDWYYDVWQGDELDHPACFPLEPNVAWHGFNEVDKDYLSLDPIKVTVLLPGIQNNELADWGIPACIVEKFLESHDIIVEKTGPYSMLFLFSIGVTKAKSMALLAALNKFKQLYDQNAPVKKVLPALYAEHPDFYASMHIQAVAEKIHCLMKNYDFTKAMYHAFDVLPAVSMTPHQAYQQLVKQKIEHVRLDQLNGRTSAVMILPYPPGVPLIMPGEKITDSCQPILQFLLMLVAIGRALPGFATDIHGLIYDENGDPFVPVLLK